MRCPTIHLNGTSADQLLAQHEAARMAVSEAIDALHAAAPNARDYYVQGTDAPTEAQRQHAACVQKLKDVLGEIELIVDDLYDQIAERDRARGPR